MGTSPQFLAGAKADLDAFRESVSMSFAEVVHELSALIGKKLTAYIGKSKDTRAVERWMGGAGPYKDIEDRMRLAFRVTKMLRSHWENPEVIQAWLTGLNPELGDRVPIRLLREGTLEEDGNAVLTAARSFLAGA